MNYYISIFSLINYGNTEFDVPSLEYLYQIILRRIVANLVLLKFNSNLFQDFFFYSKRSLLFSESEWTTMESHKAVHREALIVLHGLFTGDYKYL